MRLLIPFVKTCMKLIHSWGKKFRKCIKLTMIYQYSTTHRIICDVDLPLKQKRPFLRFLIWVYMDEEESIEGNEQLDLKKEAWTSKFNTRWNSCLPLQYSSQSCWWKFHIIYSEVWTFLNQTLTLLLSIGRVLKTLRPEEKEPLKSRLRSSNRQRVRCLSYIVSDVRLRALSVAHTIKSISSESALLPGMCTIYKGILQCCLSKQGERGSASFALFAWENSSSKETSRQWWDEY